MGNPFEAVPVPETEEGKEESGDSPTEPQHVEYDVESRTHAYEDQILALESFAPTGDLMADAVRFAGVTGDRALANNLSHTARPDYHLQQMREFNTKMIEAGNHEGDPEDRIILVTRVMPLQNEVIERLLAISTPS